MKNKPWLQHATLGALATAALLGLLLLFAQISPVSFVPLDISDAIIRVTPGAIATQGIENFGTGAKLTIEIVGALLFIAVGGLVAWLYGRIAPRNLVVAGLGLAAVPLLLTLLVQTVAGGLRGGTTGLALTTLLYVIWGFSLAWMINRLATPVAAASAAPADDPARRAFVLRSSGALLAVAFGSGAIAQLLERSGVKPTTAGAGAALPGSAPQPTSAPVAQAATAMPASTADAPTDAPAPTSQSSAAAPTAQESAAAAPTDAPAPEPTPEPTAVPFEKTAATRSPFNTNETLYVISSATRDPQVDRDQWRLEVGGAVNQPFSLTYAELLALPRVEQASTLECISNEVGNYLIGNVKWSGVQLKGLLEQAGVQDGVIDIKLTAAEGYTESITLKKALDETSLIAYGIDGEALSVPHGFPARLRVPGLYGEKNVKWLTKIEAVREDYMGYWQQRGWTDTAIIETTSVFDTANPYLGEAQPLQRENGVVPLGGIAFAGNRGIMKVEVQVDGGDWVEVTLDPQSDPLQWRFWRYDWPAEPGQHTLTIRATDGTGTLQTADERPPHPDGATGHHRITVEVV